ncbi:MAG: hypothetical protein OXI96_02405 [Acidimicrobiaceae bacterium]|nr:hypothetical protein [Acidimicrobiaceae bacterium]
MPARDTPRLRGSPTVHEGPWPVGCLPDDAILRLAERLAHRKALGFKDLGGDDASTMIAAAFEGEHLGSPVGLADMVADGGTAWSVKTVKQELPINTRLVRLVSGRNSLDYSFGVSDPRKDIQATGRYVLSIWNSRVNAALDEFNELRVVVLIRNFTAGDYVIFEQPIQQYVYDDYDWSVNKQSNFEGRDKRSGWHWFTWQPSGGQFTIRRPVPGSARRFRFTRPIPYHSQEFVLRAIGYDNTWVDIG